MLLGLFFLPSETEGGKLMGYTASVFSELTFEVGKRLLAAWNFLYVKTRQFLCLEWVEAGEQR